VRQRRDWLDRVVVTAAAAVFAAVVVYLWLRRAAWGWRLVRPLWTLLVAVVQPLVAQTAGGAPPAAPGPPVAADEL
jgi:hypothetical protein